MTTLLVVCIQVLLSFSAKADTEGPLSRCPTASECRLANRAPCPDPVQGYCGLCLSGYVQGADDACIEAPLKNKLGSDLSRDHAVKSVAVAGAGSSVASCPEPRLCAASFRLPCTASSGSNCGSCLPDYIDVEGVCISESDAVALLHFIEADASRRNSHLLAAAGSGAAAAAADSGATAGKPQDVAAILKQSVSGASGMSAADGSRSGSQSGAIGEASSQKILGNARADLSTSSLAPADNSALRNESAAADAIHDNGIAVAQIQDPHLPSSPARDISQLASIAIILGAALLTVAAITTASVYWYRLMKKRKRDDANMTTKRFSSSSSGSLDDRWHHSSPKGGAATSAALSPPGGFDKKLAQSALMYHFEHSKQQIVTRQKAVASKDLPAEISDSDADDEAETCKTEQGDYTVYECPGLAPTSDLEVHNPLFDTASVRKSASLDSNSNSSISSPAEERRK